MRVLLLATIFSISAYATSYAAPISSLGTLTDNGVGTINVTSPGSALTGGAANYNTVFETSLDSNNATTPDNNTINLDLVYNSYGSMSALFNFSAANVDPPGPVNPATNLDNYHLYRFNLNVSTLSASQKPITGFGVSVSAVSPTGRTILPDLSGNDIGVYNVGPTANDLDGFDGPLNGLNFISSTQIEFGNGFGPGITTTPQTLSFLLLIRNSSSSGSFVLNFTANPEPTSLALGGAALLGFGGVILRRRRNVKSA